VHKSYGHESFSFMSGVAPLPTDLDSSSAEARRNTNIVPLPTNLVSTPA